MGGEDPAQLSRLATTAAALSLLERQAAGAPSPRRGGSTRAPRAPTSHGEPTLGREDGRSATLSQSEIGALVAQIRACITLPAGAEDADARAEFTFSIGADGMVSGRPQMTSAPSSQIEDAYARAVSRALQRCGPFTVAAGQDVRAQFAAREF